MQGMLGIVPVLPRRREKAGPGGTVALTAAMEDLAAHTMMFDADRGVAAFWPAAL